MSSNLMTHLSVYYSFFIFVCRIGKSFENKKKKIHCKNQKKQT